MISLFSRTRFAVPVDREFARSALELLRELMSGIAERPQIQKIRCYFRCILERETQHPIGCRRSADMIRMLEAPH
jgi:hypothetical protein